MRILFVGDVVGRPGRRALAAGLATLRRDEAPDRIVVNGENSAAGHGITPATARELFRAGADVITTGNHVWDHREIVPFLDRQERLLRPLNYPAGSPGTGVCTVETADGCALTVVCLMGRVFTADVDDPFRSVDGLLASLEPRRGAILVDFHAETTSEKMAMGWYLDGRVAAVVGTHTHVPTADERVLPGGTAYISDVGMTGPFDSVIGMDKKQALERFLTQRPVRFSPASADLRLCGVLIDCDPEIGRARSIRRVEWREDGPTGGGAPS